MRIILDLQGAQNGSRFRGIGRYAISLAQEMVRRGSDRHEFHLLLNHNLPEGLPGVAAAFKGLLSRSQFHIIELPKPTFEAAADNSWRTRAAELIREAALYELAPDLVHITSLFEGFGDNCVSSIGALGRYIPTVITLYDMIPLLQPDVYLGEGRPRFWYHRKAQLAKRADLLLAISTSSAAEGYAVLDLPPGRIVTVGTGIDDKFRPIHLDAPDEKELRRRYRLEKPFVMYAGAADARKNLHGLVEAFGRLPEPVRARYCLAIVGKLTLEEVGRIKGYAVAAGLAAEDVVFTGFVLDDDLIRLYSLCIAMVFPSFHEGFGLPAAEAMACGAPVIGSNRTSIPEVIGRADALFDPSDFASIAERLGRVLTDPMFREELRRHGPVQASRFNWKDVADRSLAAFEWLHGERHLSKVAKYVPRLAPLVAFISPLPPEQGAVARHAARLLPEFATVCDVTGIAEQPGTDAWLATTVPVRSLAWLEAHAERFDHIIYSLADCLVTPALLETMRIHHGCAFLHDARLSTILKRISEEEAVELLYAAHGWHAALFAMQEGLIAATQRFDCLSTFLSEVALVFTHSPALARHVRARLGVGGPDVICIPPPTGTGIRSKRSDARARLELTSDQFVVCSLVTDDATIQRQVLDGWLSLSAIAHRDTLLFACCHAPQEVTAAVLADVVRFGDDRTRVVGAPDAMQDALVASDLVLHLGSLPGAEVAMLLPELLQAGLPVLTDDPVVWGALPPEAVVSLPTDPDAWAIAEALERLRADPAWCGRMAASLRAHGKSWLAPGAIAASIGAALGTFATGGARSAAKALHRKLSELQEPCTPADLATAQSATRINRQPVGSARLFIDVSMQSLQDRTNDIRRVCRSIVKEMAANPPPGYRVEPICWIDGNYSYARQYVRDLFTLDGISLLDEPVGASAGDIYFGLDPIMETISEARPWFEAQRLRGMRTMFVFHGLLPVRHPMLFPPHIEPIYREWMGNVLELADGVVGISRTVMHEVMDWLQGHPSCRTKLLQLGWFHPGCDLEAASPMMRPLPQTTSIARAFRQRDTFLSVGEIKSHSGYSQALAAFDTLWASGVDVNYVIAGDRGWMEEPFFEQLEAHPELGRRLFWFRDVSDEVLAELYRRATVLLATSEAEGSGLSLIEAASFGLPIIARDIPVFQEVAAGHASFFDVLSGTELAADLTTWLSRWAACEVPGSATMPFGNWCASAQRLADVAVRGQWSLTWKPNGEAVDRPGMTALQSF